MRAHRGELLFRVEMRREAVEDRPLACKGDGVCGPQLLGIMERCHSAAQQRGTPADTRSTSYYSYPTDNLTLLTFLQGVLQRTEGVDPSLRQKLETALRYWRSWTPTSCAVPRAYYMTPQEVCSLATRDGGILTPNEGDPTWLRITAHSSSCRQGEAYTLTELDTVLRAGQQWGVCERSHFSPVVSLPVLGQEGEEALRDLISDIARKCGGGQAQPLEGPGYGPSSSFIHTRSDGQMEEGQPRREKLACALQATVRDLTGPGVPRDTRWASHLDMEPCWGYSSSKNIRVSFGSMDRLAAAAAWGRLPTEG